VIPPTQPQRTPALQQRGADNEATLALIIRQRYGYASEYCEDRFGDIMIEWAESTRATQSFSTSGLDSDRATCLFLGVRQFITKPDSYPAFVNAMRRDPAQIEAVANRFDFSRPSRNASC
jgi:hypothetical protein